MSNTPLNLVAARLINRVLSDYPLAQQRLAPYAGSRVDVAVVGLPALPPVVLPVVHPEALQTLAPLSCCVRITTNGFVEPISEGRNAVVETSFTDQTGSTGPAGEQWSGVAFRIPVDVLPALLRKDPAAYQRVAFDGDSELAHALSTIARGVEWDIEEDLSRLLGGGTTADIAAHRVVSTVKSFGTWRKQATERFTENVAEYLVHERNAFVTRDELEDLARENDTLRDDVARLGARLALLSSPP